jgi:hypothetical protein
MVRSHAEGDNAAGARSTQQIRVSDGDTDHTGADQRTSNNASLHSCTPHSTQLVARQPAPRDRTRGARPPPATTAAIPSSFFPLPALSQP